jgi:transcriptional regulator with XRE-family HTH domain
MRERIETDPARKILLEAGRQRVREGLALQELRARQGVTQVELARTLNRAQANISRLERRGDVRVSSLAEYIEGLGGRLEIRAVFPDQTVPLRIVRERASRTAASKTGAARTAR